jgi:hypothetical protein
MVKQVTHLLADGKQKEREEWQGLNIPFKGTVPVT